MKNLSRKLLGLYYFLQKIGKILQAEIDRLVGKLYGLDKKEMEYILNKFHHANPEIEKELRTLEELILNDY